MSDVTLSAKVVKDGEAFTLAVKCSVSGAYRRAKISGDPDSCYEAEYPEVEPIAATWEERENLETGEVRNPAEGEDATFDLHALDDKAHRALMDELYESLRDFDSYEPDYEPDYDPCEGY